MADTKISALTASTTPLAGTEVLPIVQGGVTKQVSVANLTAGRAVSATQMTLTTGNLIVANGKGIDFSATPGTGTSELLADYEEGIWTPAVLFGGVTFSTIATASYTKIGRLVFVQMDATVAANVNASQFVISGLPFALASSQFAGVSFGLNSSSIQLGALVANSGLEFYTPVGITAISNAQVSGARMVLSASYQTS